MIKGVIALLFVFLLMGTGIAKLEYNMFGVSDSSINLEIYDAYDNGCGHTVAFIFIELDDTGNIHVEGIKINESYNVSIILLGGVTNT
jgi:hypothetical protein